MKTLALTVSASQDEYTSHGLSSTTLKIYSKLIAISKLKWPKQSAILKGEDILKTCSTNWRLTKGLLFRLEINKDSSQSKYMYQALIQILHPGKWNNTHDKQIRDLTKILT